MKTCFLKNFFLEQPSLYFLFSCYIDSSDDDGDTTVCMAFSSSFFFFCKVFHVGKLGSLPCLYYTSFYVTLKIFLRLVLLPNRLTIKEKENLWRTIFLHISCFVWMLNTLGKFGYLNFPGGSAVKKNYLQCRRHRKRRFSPSVGKIPWRIPRTEEPGGLESIGL